MVSIDTAKIKLKLACERLEKNIEQLLKNPIAANHEIAKELEETKAKYKELQKLTHNVSSRIDQLMKELKLLMEK